MTDLGGRLCVCGFTEAQHYDGYGKEHSLHFSRGGGGHFGVCYHFVPADCDPIRSQLPESVISRRERRIA